MIHLYLKIPKNFVCFIFKDGFWLVHILCICSYGQIIIIIIIIIIYVKKELLLETI